MDKKRILVVDDENDMLFAIKLHLETAGYEVLTASDGQEAFDKGRNEKPDLILLDLMLPKIDGYKVCRMLKFDEKYKNIPIIMLTACVQDEDKNLGFDVGANAYVTKPFEPEELLLEIQKLF